MERDGETATPSVDPAKAATDPELAKQDKSNRESSWNNLRQIGLAVMNYSTTRKGRLPDDYLDRKGKPMLSWRVRLLPYFELETLYREFKLDEPWDSKHNLKLLDKMPGVYRSRRVKLKGKGNTVYQVFNGPDAVFGRGVMNVASITDGTSNTILAVEASKAVPWTKPADIYFDRKKAVPDFGKAYGKKPGAVMMDGSYRLLDLTKISETTLKNAIDPADGFPLGADW